MDWKNKKIWVVVVALVFLSSTFYGAITTQSMGGGRTIKVKVGVDFGSGRAYPKTYQVTNRSAFSILNLSVGSLEISNNRLKCISGVCGNESKTWNFYVNYQGTERNPFNYYPNNNDVLIFRFENKTPSRSPR